MVCAVFLWVVLIYWNSFDTGYDRGLSPVIFLVIIDADKHFSKKNDIRIYIINMDMKEVSYPDYQIYGSSKFGKVPIWNQKGSLSWLSILHQ